MPSSIEKRRKSKKSLKTFRQQDGLKIRREFLQKIKTQVQLYLGQESSTIRSYALAYKKDIERGNWRPSTHQIFQNAVKNADISFGGDFHAFAQAQRVHLRILRNFGKNRKIILALECIPSKHQKSLDQYIQGEMGEDVFLKKTNWEKNWGFPWSQYKPYFELARENGWKCLALNLELPQKAHRALYLRDKHAVDVLVHAYKNKSDQEGIYVIYGDLHIAREKIPALFKKAVSNLRAPKIVSIYLNPEKIYFRLFKKNLEHKINVVQFAKNEFCLIESPPWVKWQSYLIFLEETLDDSLFEEEGELDYAEHVESLIKMMGADLKVQIHGDVSVYSFNDHYFLELLSAKVPKESFEFIKRCVQNDMTFYDPTNKTAFLSRSTVNYAAHLAGHIFHGQLCQRQQFLYRFPEDFIKVIWSEAMAFFLSKLVNPNRKSLILNDLKKQLAAFSPGEKGEEVLKLALDQKMRDLVLVYGSQKIPEQTIKCRDDLNYYKAAKLLGAMLGERIFKALKAGRLSRLEIMKWISHKLESKDFQNFYIQVLRDLDNIDIGGANE